MAEQLHNLKFSEERLAYLKAAVLNDTRAFSGAQLAILLPPLVFSDDMVNVCYHMP